MTQTMTKEKEYFTVRTGNGRNTVYSLIELNEPAIWLELKILGDSAFLCAITDGTPMIQMPCGSKNVMKTFVNIEWAINEWGTENEETIADLKRAKERFINDIPNIRRDMAGKTKGVVERSR